MVRQRSAKSPTPVQFRSAPPILDFYETAPTSRLRCRSFSEEVILKLAHFDDSFKITSVMCIMAGAPGYGEEEQILRL